MVDNPAPIIEFSLSVIESATVKEKVDKDKTRADTTNGGLMCKGIVLSLEILIDLIHPSSVVTRTQTYLSLFPVNVHHCSF